MAPTWGSVGLGSDPPCGSYVERSRQINADYRAGRITLDEAIARAHQVSVEVQEAKRTGRCGGTTFNYNYAEVLDTETALIFEQTAGTYRQTSANYTAALAIVFSVALLEALIWWADR